MNKQIAIFGGRECIKEKEKHYFSMAYELVKLWLKIHLLLLRVPGPD